MNNIAIFPALRPWPTPKQEPIHRILTERFSVRLSLANAAYRSVKGMGYQVIAISFNGDTPQIQVQGKPFPEMRKLTERAGQYHVSDGRCSVILGAVRVWWYLYSEKAEVAL